MLPVDAPEITARPVRPRRTWTRASLVVRAVRHKLRAVHALGTFWPAVIRGGKLLARGRFRSFVAKLVNESAAVRAADAAPVRKGPPLVVAGHILRPGGYDHVVFAILKGLLDAGVDVHRDPASVMKAELIPVDLRPGEGDRRTEYPRLVATPPHLLARFHPDRRTAAFTMWETDTLPAGAVAALNCCGLVIVPSQWGADCFRANGVRPPIAVVPLGRDPAVFRPSPLDGDDCVFGTAGALDAGGLRKNVQRVIDLFRRAFPNEPDARLRVKITPTSPLVETYADPRIDVIARSLEPDELASWYRSLTAFVNGSFGEGFGLHLLEAMGCGRPLISTTFGGVSAFFDETVGYPVRYQLVEARNAVYSGHWADPDDGELIDRMRRVYRDRDRARQLGERAAERAAGFTWGETARALIDVLKQHDFLPVSAGQRHERDGE